MSYDLYFFKKPDNPVSGEEIKAYLDGVVDPNLPQPEEDSWDYLNEDTGAYCRFTYYEDEDSNDEEAEEDEGFEGFEDTSLSISLNFLRPDFFAFECFPLVEKLCSALNLYVSDPQRDGTPRPYDNGIVESWLTSNRKVAEAGFEEYGLYYMDKQTSDDIWQYNFNRNKLQEEMGEEVFVPRIMFVNKHDTKTIELLTVWPSNIPYLLPKTDLVLIRREVKKIFWTKEEEGFVRYEDLIEALGLHFVPRGEHLYLPPGRVNAEVKRKFKKLPIISSLDDYGTPIAPDHFVNVKPGSEPEEA
ncbi:hypothetical protein AB9P05_13185 [Roseivirga sp. BDSF3-8]|uniref:hypothetical protein n=1 Tax=Roseivirga sp. BDSF3-8 TaxID=3241598 RepID=UPI0035321DC7